MGVFTRPDSPYWWLWLETAPPPDQREKTAIKVGQTVRQRQDSKIQALAVYHTRMGELAAKIHRLPVAKTALRFRDYAVTYQRDVLPHLRSADRSRELLKTLIAHLGDELVTRIDQDRVRAYLTVRRQTVAASTANREVNLLKSMIRDAVPKYLDVSPLVGMKRLTETKPKRRLMTLAEERRLLSATRHPQDRALVIIALDSLVRMGDVVDLRRTDRHGRWIYLADPKSGEPCEVALSPRGAAALTAIPDEGPYYFAKFRRSLRPSGTRDAVRHMFERLCVRAKVPYGRAHGGITFHWATRRTGATRMLLDKRVPLPAVQRQGTWKTPDVLLQIYAEARREDLLHATMPLPRHSRSERKRA